MSTRRAVRSLGHDERGAIMVAAVFMAVFLVAALWYIVGIGHAVLYRERMQDGADAVAYAGAVYHARGMNLIAMINVIMAGLLAVLVAMKLVQAINTIANAISCVIAGFCLGTCFPIPEVCAWTGYLKNPISTAVSAYEKFLKPTLKGLSIAQKGIAITMPWVAEAKSVTVSQHFNEPVEGGGILSASLIPKFPNAERLGLPVQEEDNRDFLCGKAGKYVGDVIMAPFSPYGNWVGGVIGGLAKAFPGYFCNGGGTLGFNPGKAAVDQLCTQKKKKWDDDHKNDKNPPAFDMKQCQKDGQKDLSKETQKQLNQMGPLSAGTDNTTSMKVFELAENGNGYFQVWSVVVGNDSWAKQVDRGVQIAAWDKSPGVQDKWWGKIGFAQAEFYYDWHATKDQPSGHWDDYKEEALWHMWWRARFRRVRPPVGDVVDALGGVATQKLKGAIDDKVKDAMSNVSFMKWLLGTKAEDELTKEMKSFLESGVKSVGQQAQGAADHSFDKYEVIH